MRDRRRAWTGAREALWSLVDRHLELGARVAVVGAGRADDLPLTALLRRAASVDLFDVDRAALGVACRREPRQLRSRLRVHAYDITGGAGERIVRAALLGLLPIPPSGAHEPLSGGPYDMVIADLLYSQLLYPALRDAQLPAESIDSHLDRFGPGLTASVVSRLQRSAPNGVVIHLHDILGWWDGHAQPFALDDVLAAAQHSPDGARELLARDSAARDSDPREALARMQAEIIETAFWRWPCTTTCDYLVEATVVRGGLETI